jgi:hypothetical protein
MSRLLAKAGPSRSGGSSRAGVHLSGNHHTGNPLPVRPNACGTSIEGSR